MRLRLLPILICAGAVLLTVRTGTMWQQASIGTGQPSFAETQEAAPAEPSAPAGAAPADGAESEATAAEPADAAAEDNPFAYSDSEIALLQSLARRRAELDKREAALGEREALIAAAEKRMDEKLAELKNLDGKIQAALGEQQASDEQMASLVKIYETMKPKDAARIFDQLDFAVLVEVVGRMREAKSAPVLAAMDPEKAKLVTVALAAKGAAPQLAGAAPALPPPAPANAPAALPALPPPAPLPAQ